MMPFTIIISSHFTLYILKHFKHIFGSRILYKEREPSFIVSYTFIFKIHFQLYVSVCEYVHMSVDAHKYQPETWDCLELGYYKWLGAAWNAHWEPQVLCKSS